MDDTARIDEKLRLQDLRSFDLLDAEAGTTYDDVVKLAAAVCDAPIAMVSWVDENRQSSKACWGMDTQDISRDESFCAQAILDPLHVLQVRDAWEDARFRQASLVTGASGVRFYAGAPLRMPSGAVLGTVCVMDRKPRELSASQADALQALARCVVQTLILRRANTELENIIKGHELRQLRIEEINQDLQEQSLTDPLTALKNRRAFDHLLISEFARAKRTKAPLCLLMVDADHFKSYNDTYGHVAGDEALVFIALAIKSQSRAYDHVARYGGEEFCVILPDTSLKDGLMVAQRVREAIKGIVGLRRPMTASVGMGFSEGLDTPQSLVEVADRAMYLAKQGGRDRVEVFVPPVQAPSSAS